MVSSRFTSRDKGAKPNSVPQASKRSSNYSRFLCGSVRIWRFIEMGCRKRRTDSAGPIGVNLFPSLLLVKKKIHPSRKEGSALASSLLLPLSVRDVTVNPLPQVPSSPFCCFHQHSSTHACTLFAPSPVFFFFFGTVYNNPFKPPATPFVFSHVVICLSF